MAVAFGTSGLRGPAGDFSPETCHAYVAAFLGHVSALTAARIVYLGGDLRDSTPWIAQACTSAIRQEGWTPVWAGNVPTPALAAYALERSAPAIMVTGSHIPETYNGIKFYRPDGEFLKDDEQPVKSGADANLAAGLTLVTTNTGPADPVIGQAYVARYIDAFGTTALAGLKIGIDLHSAVGRDLTVAIFKGLGAECHTFRRADHFIAVDTEALDPEDISRDRAKIAELGLDAVISTDGDGDRPLVIDETGQQINGDVLGAITARALGIKSIVTPLSSTSAIELSGWFDHVERTKIGSPYVVAAMQSAQSHPVAGFEANGGFLLGDDLVLEHGKLTALPTRDAILPMVASLMESAKRGVTLSALAAMLPPRFMKADRVKNVAPDLGRIFLSRILDDRSFRAQFDPRVADPTSTSSLDGIRMEFANGSTVHFRQSGNAPEMRLYIETSDRTDTETLLSELILRLAGEFHHTGD